MVRTVFLLNEFLVNVRINLRRADVRMSEEFLQHAQVHARLQAMRGKAVPAIILFFKSSIPLLFFTLNSTILEFSTFILFKSIFLSKSILFITNK